VTSERLRIGLNLLYLLPAEVGGTETYARGLIHALVATRPDDEFLVFVNAEAAAWPLPSRDNVRRIVCPVSAANRGARYRWEQLQLPREVSRHAPDVLHSLGYVGPILAGRPHVVTVHDCNFLEPDVPMGRVRRLVLRSVVGLLGTTADRLLTDSSFSARALAERVGVPREKLLVVPLASDFQPQRDAAAFDACRYRYGVTEPYVVAFSSQSPHKNIDRLLTGFAEVAAQLPHQLVLLGHVPPGGELASQATALGLSDRVVSTGFVPDADADTLLEGASAFVFPSLYEGFGLPVLNAQRAEVPVACSTAASLPEVAGDGALYFDPRHPSAIAQVLIRCCTDEPERRRLVAAGLRNAMRFSWTGTADQTFAVYRQLAARAQSRR
jgi:glycosyltransferase involved in cell wall biosynthesis